MYEVTEEEEEEEVNRRILRINHAFLKCLISTKNSN